MSTDNLDRAPVTLRFECFGNSCHDTVTIELPNGSALFDFEQGESRDTRYHAGLFFDYHAASWKNYLRYPWNRRIAVLGEPNASELFLADSRLGQRFRMVFTHDERLLRLGQNYAHQPFGTSWLNVDIRNDTLYPKNKLVSMIGAPHPEARAGHALRNEVIARLQQRGGVDQFGKGIRWIENKIEGLQDYAFSIAMENCSRNYYFTEKIIDCFLTDTIPIYWGCPGIDQYFDPRGYLHFQTMEELEKILTELSWDKYSSMIPYCRANRARAVDRRLATRQQYFERLTTTLEQTISPSYSLCRPNLLSYAHHIYKTLCKAVSAN